MLRSFAVLTFLGAAIVVSGGSASAFDGAPTDATKAAKVYMPAGRPLPQANNARTSYRSFSFMPNGGTTRRSAALPPQFRADRKIRSGNTN